MKKKIMLIAGSLFVFASVEAFSFGIGLRGNFGWGIYGGGLLFSTNERTHFGANYYVGEDSFHLGVTGDFWLLQVPLTSVGSGELDFYAGPGLYVQIDKPKDDDFDFGLGLRIPVGLDLGFDIFDVFLEFAPQIGVSFLPSPGLSGNWFSAAIGFRFWIGE
ncbi:MAG: hypothetical protein LBO04_00175 [Spirochaetaceae bacterium]|nr:hypothetical protein [Spirochaetaceae bacterium]